MLHGKLRDAYDLAIDHAVMINRAVFDPSKLSSQLNPYRDRLELNPEQQSIRREKDSKIGMKIMAQFLARFKKPKKGK